MEKSDTANADSIHQEISPGRLETGDKSHARDDEVRLDYASERFID